MVKRGAWWAAAIAPDGSLAPICRRILLALWLLAIAAVVIGSLSPKLAPSGRLGLDKLVHVVAYAALGGLPGMVFARPARLVAAGAMIMLGGIIELAQAQVPGRSGDIADFLASAAGVVLGLGFAAALRTRLLRWVLR